MISLPELNERVLHLDWDWKPPKKWVDTWINAKLSMLERMGYKVGDVVFKLSDAGKGRGYHIWLHVFKPSEYTEDEVNMLQWLLLDDQTRVRINRLRTRRGLRKYWNKIFSLVLWRKPLPRQCVKCRLRKYFHEIEGEVGE
mgnify:CR=1 FL=1